MDHGDVASRRGRDVDVLHAPAAGSDELQPGPRSNEVLRDRAEMGEQNVSVSDLLVGLARNLLRSRTVLLQVLGTVLELLARGIGPLDGNDLSV